MAIINAIRGLEVTVEIEGEKATEYNDPSSEPEVDDDEVRVLASATIEDQSVEAAVRDKERHHHVRYIEAKPGRAFLVRLVQRPEFQQVGRFLMWRVTVDGNKSFLLYNDKLKKNQAWNSSEDSVYSHSKEQGYIEHHFKFAPLQVESTDARLDSKKISLGKHCGTILVEVWHMSGVNVVHREPLGKHKKPTAISSLPEKALKGKALSVRAEYESQPSTREFDVNKLIYHDTKKRPFATFEFRYRSKEDLMQEMIVPRPTRREEIQRMTPAELMEELQRAEERIERLRKSETADVKSEAGSPGMRGVKREASDDGDVSGAPAHKQPHLDDGIIEID